MIHFDVAQGSEDWLQQRLGCITGSRFKDCRDYGDGLTDQQRTYVNHMRAGELEEVAREMAGYKAAPRSETVSRCIKHGFERVWSDSARRYAMDLARERCGGRAPSKFKTGAMRLGQEQEGAARFRYEAMTGLLVREVGIFKTPDLLFGVSPDGLIGDDGVLEIKTMVSSDTLFTAVADGDISEYVDQCLGYLWLLGRKWVDLALWCYDLDKLVIRRIERDEDAIEDLESDLIAFAGIVNSYTASLTSALNGERAAPTEKAQPIPDHKPVPKAAAKAQATTVQPKPQAAPVAVDLPDLF